jgi:hypothetical protein
VHRSYEHVLPDSLQQAKAALPHGFDYTVVKFNYHTKVYSFVMCPDFDTADEPTVGDIHTVKSDGTASFRRGSVDPWIYHHKWLFVADDYAGFDVEQSRKRSRAWLSLEGIDKRRIGKQSYWRSIVVPRLEAAD